MKYATTDDLIRLNDAAVLCDFNEWLTVDFFDDVAPEELHVLAYGFPHGIRPGSAVTEPPHYRTVWYARMRDGSDNLIKLDVAVAELELLPEIPDTAGIVPVALMTDDVDSVVLPSVVILENGDGEHEITVDGKHVLAAIVLAGESQELEVARITGLSAVELEAIRAQV